MTEGMRMGQISCHIKQVREASFWRWHWGKELKEIWEWNVWISGGRVFQSEGAASTNALRWQRGWQVWGTVKTHWLLILHYLPELKCHMGCGSFCLFSCAFKDDFSVSSGNSRARFLAGQARMIVLGYHSKYHHLPTRLEDSEVHLNAANILHVYLWLIAS